MRESARGEPLALAVGENERAEFKGSEEDGELNNYRGLQGLKPPYLPRING
jgi:hypothetical protein